MIDARTRTTRRPKLAIWLITAIAVGTSCGSGDAGTTAEAPTQLDVQPVTSIPFCGEPPINLPGGGTDLTGQELEQQNDAMAAMSQIEAEFGDEPEWAGSYYDHEQALLVVRLTDDNTDLAADITDLTSFDVRVTTVTYSSEERQRAGDMLLELMGSEEHPDSPLTGYGTGGLVPFVEISLSTFDDAETLADDWHIPPPLDIYCIMPTADPQFGELDR